jgi:hypothetical protein
LFVSLMDKAREKYLPPWLTCLLSGYQRGTGS